MVAVKVENTRDGFSGRAVPVDKLRFIKGDGIPPVVTRDTTRLKWRLVMPKTLLLLALFLTLTAGCVPTAGFKFRTGPNVTIGTDAVVKDDLYLAGGMINVQGPVDGDVTAAGGQITIGNEVTGDVTVSGGQIRIEGPVGDDLRVAGGDITVLSDVTDDVIAAGGTVILDAQATVGGDLITGAGMSVVRGTVAGNVITGSDEVVISGTVQGDADIRANRLTLEPTARIQGDLRYLSRNEATVHSGAQVLGTTTREVPRMSIAGVEVEASPFNRALAAVVGQARWFLGSLAVGLLLLLVAPSIFRSARMTLELAPWASLAMGLGVLVLVPIITAILGVIAIVIGGFAGVPVAVVPMATYFVFLALATPVVALVIGRFILSRLSSSEPAGWLSLVLGTLILALVGFVPYLNIAVGVLTIIFGFGAWLLLGWRSYTLARREHRV
jgi:cytoskeletal protein CcmA (bactofilin family)